MVSPVQISVSQLSRLIGIPESPVVLDVRTKEDFDMFYRWARDAVDEAHN